jgi:hypothetical protein
MFRVAVVFLVSLGVMLLAFGGWGYASMCIDGGCFAFACPSHPMNPMLCPETPPDPCPGAPATCRCEQLARKCQCCKKP